MLCMDVKLNERASICCVLGGKILGRRGYMSVLVYLDRLLVVLLVSGEVSTHFDQPQKWIFVFCP